MEAPSTAGQGTEQGQDLPAGTPRRERSYGLPPGQPFFEAAGVGTLFDLRFRCGVKGAKRRSEPLTLRRSRNTKSSDNEQSRTQHKSFTKVQ